jgi:ribonuclease III
MKFEYTFNNKNILIAALTHPSAVKNKDNSYERMEFLGDSILNAIIADIIYTKFKNYSEGQLSVIQANLVNSKTLNIVANNIGLAKEIILDNGEEQCGGRTNPNNLENALEALIAAIYLDSDFYKTKEVIGKWWEDFFLDINKLFQKDFKTQLQELVQKKYKLLPKYKAESKVGEAHNPTFTISVSFKNTHKVSAEGKTKKEAEQNAAQAMLKHIAKQNE